MKLFLQLVAFAAIAFIFAACGTTKKIETLKPEPNYSTDIVYDKQTSYLNLPVEVSVADLQTQTNKYLNGLIYEDNQIEGDNLMMKVWKQALIAINENAGKLEMVLPLKIWVKVRYGIEKFGLSAYDTRELNLNGSIKLSSLVAFRNWKLTTNTQIGGIDWAESPSITIAGKNVPITYLINPAVALFKPKLGKMVDDAIAQSLDIKPFVLSALDKISKPQEINPTYHVWFAMKPLELYTNQAIVANKKISVVMGMKAYLETAVNAKPTISFDKNKLVLLAADKLPDDFNVSIASVITYDNAAVLMQQNFEGKKFESGSRSITVTKTALWGKDGKMIVELGMKGSVNGNFYLTGVPAYDSTKKEMYIDQVQFVLDSKNKLLQFGDWIAHGTILKRLKENCRYSVNEQLNQGSNTLKTYLSNYEPTKGVKVNGYVTGLSPKNITLTPNAIITMITASGKVAVSVDGMK
ncbi:DUF4403 family protein [Parasediminibacterium sp. JCM 36343]|uniref:DUF4403 family protein n=1 Tax=Parasediminibacterium sp. JCM 36343 TaxID=3374279 RepID=UPI00397A08E0